MLFSLPTGKVLYISVEFWLSMSDLDLEYLMASDEGFYCNNPFSGSILEEGYYNSYEDEYSEDEDLEGFSEDDIFDEMLTVD
jgi:hypothetical protein